MYVTVGDIVNLIEKIAPSRLAEKWDNSGLQIGKLDWPVKRVLISLDPTPDVIEAACNSKTDLLITHHPMIFNPLKSIDFSSSIGALIYKAAINNLAIFSAHTNLDSAADGINDILVLSIGLKNLKTLSTTGQTDKCKFVVYVPADYEHKIIKALFETKAGVIGSYTCCSFRNTGKGTFKPGYSAKPFIGTIDEISHVDEVRIEVIADKHDIPEIVSYIRHYHPYETMAYDVYPLYEYDNKEGLGRIGELEEKQELHILAKKIKENLALTCVRVVGNPEILVNHVAICSGSGSGLLNDFFKSGAQVYITGDLRYHDARSAEFEGRGLIDIGHFASEYLIVEKLAQKLNIMAGEAGYGVIVEACRIERDPFVIL
ncbi:MAG: Nif3-like dinuclear metal center hexameric protein [Proteobacteria bacterium]|nr:Nif3-like dinuclear metal center hexameric protein [Pseudomonadota bacterium]MBU4037378.1 Nif3-like dinuclear metal center hexameric protein [Pseudomonadota bacterium]